MRVSASRDNAVSCPATSVAFVDELESQIRSHVLATMPADPSGELAW